MWWQPGPDIADVYAGVVSQTPSAELPMPDGFYDVYIADVDCDLEALVLQPGEVQAVQWAGLDQILGMIRTGTFCGFHPSLIELIFAIHDLPGHLALPPSDAAVSRLLPASKFDVSHIDELKTVDVDAQELLDDLASGLARQLSGVR